jgi:hypothetical protein
VPDSLIDRLVTFLDAIKFHETSDFSHDVSLIATPQTQAVTA